MHNTLLKTAQDLDRQDPLASYKQAFHFPQHQGKDVLYFTGNSLGLQPKITQEYVQEVLESWKNLGVEGHFRGKRPWIDYHKRLASPLSTVVGALEQEITVMNTLTVNLHLLLASFYRPTKERFKIICEEKAFPSDAYMIQSQVRFHGLDPNTSIVKLRKRSNEHTFRTQDILEALEEHKDSCALVLIGGVNYYSGEVFEIEKITKKAKEIGAFIGWDLAHGVGNVALKLHDWQVDFASWCSYKYMNAGPGSISGCFIHGNQLKTYRESPNLPRLEGWWGNAQENRFLMQENFTPDAHADAWQLSNPPILATAPYLASLHLFQEVGMTALLQKQEKLFSFLIDILEQVQENTQFDMQCLTPTEPFRHGNQVSVYVPQKGKVLFDFLIENGVSVDWREPNLMRIAPVPFYTSFMDIWNLGQILQTGIQQISF